MAENNQPSHTMLYRERKDGKPSEHAWNLPLDHKVVEDGEVEAHQKDGWKTAAEVHAKAEPKPAGK